MPSLTLADIASILNTRSPSDPHRTVSGFASLRDATDSELSFLSSEKYLREFKTTNAAAVLVRSQIKLPPSHGKRVFLVEDTDLAVAELLNHFAPPIPRPPVGRDHTAIVAPSASIGDGARIGPHVFIGDDCRIGKDCVFHAGVYIGASTDIGDSVELFPNVVVRERISIGSRVIIHAGSILGSDGFGYRWNGKQHVKIPQIGTVIVEDDVEIGSAVCVDRAKFGATRIGKGTKIDNLVQIAHNVIIGPHCIIVGQAGVAGSVTLGAGVVLGGQSAVRDHITIGDASSVAACCGVTEDVDPNTVVSGLPGLPHRQSLREQAALRRLPDLVVQVRKLQDELAKLQKGR